MPKRRSSARAPSEKVAAMYKTSRSRLHPAAHNSPHTLAGIPKATLPLLHRPDRHIRLLEVEPGAFDDTIRCTITTHELERAPPFNAISYTWGQEQPQQQILIDGEHFSIRLNCHYAIQQARNFSPAVPIWIDSVCIDQDSTDEKSAQVQMMGDIYAKASLVLACIGHSDAASDFVAEFIDDSDSLERFVEVVEALLIDYYKHFDYGASYMSSPETSEFTKNWKIFTARPYFSRLWVLQELHEGRDRVSVLCGLTSMNWEKLEKVFVNIHNASEGLLLETSAGFKSLTAALASVRNHTTFGRLLADLIDLLCADPRDRIYGILRLIDWEQLGLSKPTVDYTISRVQLVMTLVRNGYFDHFYEVIYLVRALDVGWGEISNFRSLHPSPNPTRSYKGFVYWRVCIVERDFRGRLVADLVREDTLSARPTPQDFKAMLGDKMPLEVYTGNSKSALLCPGVLSGDIIFSAENFTIVLRPMSKGYYRVIGRAILLDDFEIREQEWKLGVRQWQWRCGCQLVTDLHRPRVTMQLTADDVVKMAVGQYSESSKRTLEQAKRHLAANLPSPGSIFYDDYVAWVANGTLPPALKKNCAVHREEDIRWEDEYGLLWNLAMASGDSLRAGQ